MRALENDLKNEEMRKLQKKSVADMTTEELIEALKKDVSTTKKEKSMKERFHDITKTKGSDDDFEKLLLHTSNAKKDAAESAHKKSIHSTTKQSHDATHKVSAKSNVHMSDAEIQKKGMELLTELMQADKKALAQQDSKDAKETVEFTAAINADAVDMKKLADKRSASDEKAKGTKTQKKEAQIISKEVETIKSNEAEVQEKKGAVIEDIFKLMADDLVKKIADEVSRDAELNKRAKDTEQCDDTRSDCGELKKYCETHTKKLKVICAKTCGYCSRPCADVWVGKNAHRCLVLKGANRCQQKDVDKYCAKTCGYCGVPSPPICSKTQYGCCWDKHTMKLDKEGSNCKACENNYVYVCRRFKVECASKNIAGDFMRKNCPKTCKVCPDGCRDDPGKAFYCPFWKKDLNWCRSRPEAMREFCPVTCGMC